MNRRYKLYNEDFRSAMLIARELWKERNNDNIFRFNLWLAKNMMNKEFADWYKELVKCRGCRFCFLNSHCRHRHGVFRKLFWSRCGGKKCVEFLNKETEVFIDSYKRFLEEHKNEQVED